MSKIINEIKGSINNEMLAKLNDEISGCHFLEEQLIVIEDYVDEETYETLQEAANEYMELFKVVEKLRKKVSKRQKNKKSDETAGV